MVNPASMARWQVAKLSRSLDEAMYKLELALSRKARRRKESDDFYAGKLARRPRCRSVDMSENGVVCWDGLEDEEGQSASFRGDCDPNASKKEPLSKRRHTMEF